MFKKLIIIFLMLFLNSLCYGEESVKNHNRVNTCKNLLQKYTLEQLSSMISSGNFDDIYVGDYIEMKMTSDYGTEKVRWLVADIDYFYGKTDVPITDHHIVLLAEDCFKDLNRINSNNTTTGGFAGCEIYTTTLPKYDTAIINAFGASHILSYHQLLTIANNDTIPSMAGDNFSGASSNWGWADGAGTNPHITTLMLMTDIQVSTKVISSSYFDTGINNSQFSLFRELPEKILCGRGFNAKIEKNNAYFLCVFVKSISSGLVSADGFFSFTNKNNNRGLRPYFLFK